MLRREMEKFAILMYQMNKHYKLIEDKRDQKQDYDHIDVRFDHEDIYTFAPIIQKMYNKFCWKDSVFSTDDSELTAENKKEEDGK